MARIEFDHVTKIFGGNVRAVDDVSLTVADGELVVLVGPSGCGKSTLLRIVAGLEEPTEGAVMIDGRDVTELAPRQRDIAMVFQNYALYPHMNVRKNLGYGLRVRRTSKQEIRRRVDDVARLLGLEDLMDRRPAALSGGQQQRVAMGRAIVREPAAFLMDEPLSNLDAKLRVGMRAELARLHERLEITTIYVTHDQVEAMTLGQRVAVMREGTIQQVDKPQTLYHRPANLFVAAFIGSPSMNLVPATIDGEVVEFAGFRIPLVQGRRLADGPVILGIRPEEFEDAAFSHPELPQVEVEVSVIEELGADAHLIFTVDAPRIEAEEIKAAASDEEQAALIAEDRRALFNARVDPKTAARPGSRMRLTVNPAAFHFFDPQTRQALTPSADSRNRLRSPGGPEGQATGRDDLGHARRRLQARRPSSAVTTALTRSPTR